MGIIRGLFKLLTAPKIEVPLSIGKYKLKYKYYDVPVAGVSYYDINFPAVRNGAEVQLAHEPDNEYDENAIAVIVEGKKIGHIYRGEKQEMILDFRRRKEPVKAYITFVNKKENKINLFLGFYKA